MSPKAAPLRPARAAHAAACLVAAFCMAPLAASSSLARATDEAPQGAVTGTITFKGKVPLARTADAAGQRRPLLTVDAKSGGLRDVAVWLEPVRDEQPADSSPAPRAKAPDELPVVVINQKDFVFEPHVVAVRTGQKVRFTNSDLANHNVRGIALEKANQFNRFTGGGDAYEHRFRPEKKHRPILVGCDLHPWMSAYIYVFDHSHFAVSDREGKFRIEHVPAGKYSVVMRQPDGLLRHETTVEIDGEQSPTIEVEFREDELKPE